MDGSTKVQSRIAIMILLQCIAAFIVGEKGSGKGFRTKAESELHSGDYLAYGFDWI